MANDRAAAPASERPLPPLPEPTVWTLFPYGVIRAYTAAQVNAHALADRAASAPQAVRMPLTEAVFLNLLGQVNAFVAEQGEANFYTGPARALQRWLSGKTLAPHEREAIDKFAAAHGIVPLAPQDTGGK